jgi:hypothetical protein
MPLRLIGGQTLWNGATVATTQPNTAAIHEWFMPTNLLTAASTAATFLESNCFHVLNLNGTVDVIVIQGGMILDAVTSGDRLITAVTGSQLRAIAFGMPVVNTAFAPTTAPAGVTLAASDVAINASTGSASALSTCSGLSLAFKPFDPSLAGELGVLYAASTSDGWGAAIGIANNALYVSDGTVPAVNDQVNWAFNLGIRTSAVTTQAPTGMSGHPYLRVSGLEKVWLAMKHVTAPTGGTTTMAGVTVAGRIYACFYQEVGIAVDPASDSLMKKDWMSP